MNSGDNYLDIHRSGLTAMTPQQKELFETVALPEPSARRL